MEAWGDLGYACICTGFVLVAAGRSGDTDTADDFVPGLDRHSAANRNDAWNLLQKRVLRLVRESLEFRGTLSARVRAVYALRRANSIVSGLLPSPRIDAATLPARSTTTTETLFPSFVHCSLAPSRIISAIRIEMFFSTCGVCALANTAASIASAEAIDTRNRRGANDMVTLPDLLWPGLRTTWALDHLTPRRRKECSRPLRQ